MEQGNDFNFLVKVISNNELSVKLLYEAMEQGDDSNFLVKVIWNPWFHLRCTSLVGRQQGVNFDIGSSKDWQIGVLSA